MALIWRVLETVDYSLMRLTGRLPKPTKRERPRTSSRETAQGEEPSDGPASLRSFDADEPDPAGWD